MKKFLYKCLIALVAATLVAALVVPVAASAQGTLPPNGYCEREGEVLQDTTWQAGCINGVWKIATANPGQTLFAPIVEAIANPTPLPAGAPTTLNGMLLPTTATSVIIREDIPIGMYFYGGATAAQVFGWDSYILITKGEVYLVQKAVQGMTWLGKLATYASPLMVVATIYNATAKVVEWSYIATPAIVHPVAIAVPEAPTVLMYQDIVSGGGTYRFFESGGKCRLEKFVQWFEFGIIQSKLFVIEKPCMKDPAMSKASLLSGLHAQISEWIESGLISAAVAKEVTPYLDDILGIIIQLYKGKLQ